MRSLYQEVFTKQASKVRGEVRLLEDRLQVLSNQMDGVLDLGEDLHQKLKTVRGNQCSLNDRIEKAKANLRQYKSLLASLQS